MKENIRSINGKLKTFDEVLKKASKSEKFSKAYDEELVRLRLASEIRLSRLKKGLTQEIVAKKARMPQSVIARVESGKRGVSLATLDRIAQAVGKKIQLV